MNTPRQGIQWYVARNQKRYGPVEDHELRRLIAEGYVRPSDKLWRQGFENWADAGAIPGLFDMAKGENHPLPPPAAPISEAPVRPVQPQQPTARQSAPDLQRPQPVNADRSPENQRTGLYPEPLVDHPTYRQHQPAGQQTYTGSPPQEKPYAGYSDDKGSYTGSSSISVSDDMRPGIHRQGSWLKRIMFGLVAVGILVVGGLFALSYFVNVDSIRDQIVSLVKDQTGRDFQVRGKTSLSFFPNLGVKVNDVTLANPTGMTGEPLLRMASLTIDLKLMPLLSRKVEVNKFVLKNPTLVLLVDRHGKTNWDFSKPAGDKQADRAAFIRRVDFDSSSPEAHVHKAVWMPSDGQSSRPTAILVQSAKNVTGNAKSLKDLSLGEVKIIDGSLSYRNDASGSRQDMENINVSLNLPRLTEPMLANGNFDWRSKEIDIEVQIQSLARLLDDKPSPVKLVLASADLKGDFDGQIISLNKFAAQGKVKSNLPSLRNLAAWTGSQVPNASGYGPLSFTAIVKANAKEIIFSQADFSLDKLKGQGNANINLAGERPYIRASITADQLDLNDYLEGPNKSNDRNKAQLSPASTRSGPKRDEKDSLTNMIEQINNDKAPVIVDEATTSATSGAIAVKPGSGLDALKSADADVKLIVAKLFFRDIKVGRSDLQVKLNDGVLRTELKDLSIYGGRGVGQMTFDSTRSVPSFSSEMNLSGVSALPFLKDAMSFDWISGIANLKIKIAGAGDSQDQISKSLSGDGDISFTDGAIEGVNIPQMIRELQSGKFEGFSRQTAQKTDFSQLTGTFTMQNGVATNKDMQLVGPLLRMSGAGQVSVPKKWIDYQLQPKIVASLEGQGGAQGLAGLQIPVRVQGPWSKPNVIPDLKGALENPQTLVEGVGNIGQAIGVKGKKSKDFESIINGVLGTSKSSGDQGQTKTIDTNSILKNLLGN